MYYRYLLKIISGMQGAPAQNGVNTHVLNESTNALNMDLQWFAEDPVNIVVRALTSKDIQSIQTVAGKQTAGTAAPAQHRLEKSKIKWGVELDPEEITINGQTITVQMLLSRPPRLENAKGKSLKLTADKNTGWYTFALQNRNYQLTMQENGQPLISEIRQVIIGDTALTALRPVNGQSGVRIIDAAGRETVATQNPVFKLNDKIYQLVFDNEGQAQTLAVSADNAYVDDRTGLMYTPLSGYEGFYTDAAGDTYKAVRSGGAMVLQREALPNNNTQAVSQQIESTQENTLQKADTVADNEWQTAEVMHNGAVSHNGYTTNVANLQWFTGFALNRPRTTIFPKNETARTSLLNNIRNYIADRQSGKFWMSVFSLREDMAIVKIQRQNGQYVPSVTDAQGREITVSQNVNGQYTFALSGWLYQISLQGHRVGQIREALPIVGQNELFTAWRLLGNKEADNYLQISNSKGETATVDKDAIFFNLDGTIYSLDFDELSGLPRVFAVAAGDIYTNTQGDKFQLLEGYNNVLWSMDDNKYYQLVQVGVEQRLVLLNERPRKDTNTQPGKNIAANAGAKEDAEKKEPIAVPVTMQLLENMPKTMIYVDGAGTQYSAADKSGAIWRDASGNEFQKIENNGQVFLSPIKTRNRSAAGDGAAVNAESKQEIKLQLPNKQVETMELTSNPDGTKFIHDKSGWLRYIVVQDAPNGAYRVVETVMNSRGYVSVGAEVNSKIILNAKGEFSAVMVLGTAAVDALEDEQSEQDDQQAAGQLDKDLPAQTGGGKSDDDAGHNNEAINPFDPGKAVPVKEKGREFAQLNPLRNTQHFLNWLRTDADRRRLDNEFHIDQRTQGMAMRYGSKFLNALRLFGPWLQQNWKLFWAYGHEKTTLITNITLIALIPVVPIAAFAGVISVALAGLSMMMFVYFYGAIRMFRISMRGYTQIMYATDKSNGERAIWETSLKLTDDISASLENALKEPDWSRFNKITDTAKEDIGISITKDKKGSYHFRVSAAVSLDDAELFLHLLEETMLAPAVEKLYQFTKDAEAKPKDKRLALRLRNQNYFVGQLYGLAHWSRRRATFDFAGRNSRNQANRWILDLTKIAHQLHITGLENYQLPGALQNHKGVHLESKELTKLRHGIPVSKETARFLQLNYQLTRDELEGRDKDGRIKEDTLIGDLRASYKEGKIGGSKENFEKLIEQLRIAYKIVEKSYNARMHNAEEANRDIPIDQRPVVNGATHTTFTSAPMQVTNNMAYVAMKQKGTNMRFVFAQLNNGPQGIYDVQSRGMLAIPRRTEALMNSVFANCFPGNENLKGILSRDNTMRSNEAMEMIYRMCDPYGEKIWKNLKLQDVMNKVFKAIGQEEIVIQASLNRFLLFANTGLDKQIFSEIGEGGRSLAYSERRRIRLSGQIGPGEVAARDLVKKDILESENSMAVTAEMIDEFFDALEDGIKMYIENPKRIAQLAAKFWRGRLTDQEKQEYADILSETYTFANAEDAKQVIDTIQAKKPDILKTAKEYVQVALGNNLFNLVTSIGRFSGKIKGGENEVEAQNREDKEYLKLIAYAHYYTHQTLNDKDTYPYIISDLAGRMDFAHVSAEYREKFRELLEDRLTNKALAVAILNGAHIPVEQLSAEFGAVDKNGLIKSLERKLDIKNKPHNQAIVNWLANYLDKQNNIARIANLKELDKALYESELARAYGDGYFAKESMANIAKTGGIHRALHQATEQFMRLVYSRAQQRANRDNKIHITQALSTKIYSGPVEETLKLSKEAQKQLKQYNELKYEGGKLTLDFGSGKAQLVALIKNTAISSADRDALDKAFEKYNVYNTNAIKRETVTEKIKLSDNVQRILKNDYNGDYKTIKYNAASGAGTLTFTSNSLAFVRLLNDVNLTVADERALREIFEKHMEYEESVTLVEEGVMEHTFAFTEKAMKILEDDDYRFDIGRIAERIESEAAKKNGFELLDSDDRYRAVAEMRHLEAREKILQAFYELNQKLGSPLHAPPPGAEFADTRDDEVLELVDSLMDMYDEAEFAIQAAAQGIRQQTNHALVDLARLDRQKLLDRNEYKDKNGRDTAFAKLADLTARDRDAVVLARADVQIKLREQAGYKKPDTLNAEEQENQEKRMTAVKNIFNAGAKFLNSYADKHPTSGGGFHMIAPAKIQKNMADAILRALELKEKYNDGDNLTLNVFEDIADPYGVSNGEDFRKVYNKKTKVVVAHLNRKIYGNQLPLLIAMAGNVFSVEGKGGVVLDVANSELCKIAGIDEGKLLAHFNRVMPGAELPDLKGQKIDALDGAGLAVLNILAAEYLSTQLRKLGLNINTKEGRKDARALLNDLSAAQVKIIESEADYTASLETLIRDAYDLHSDVALVMADQLKEAFINGAADYIEKNNIDVSTPAGQAKVKEWLKWLNARQIIVTETKPSEQELKANIALQQNIYLTPTSFVNAYQGYQNPALPHNTQKGHALTYLNENIMADYINTTSALLTETKTNAQGEKYQVWFTKNAETKEPETMFYEFRVTPKKHNTFKPETINQTMIGSNVFENIQALSKLVLQRTKKWHGAVKPSQYWRELKDRMGRATASAMYDKLFYNGKDYQLDEAIERIVVEMDGMLAAAQKSGTDLFANADPLDKKRNSYKRIDELFDTAADKAIFTLASEINKAQTEAERQKLQDLQDTLIRARHAIKTMNEMMDIVLRTDFDKDNYTTGQYNEPPADIWRFDNDGNLVNSDTINIVTEQELFADPTINIHQYIGMADINNFEHGDANAQSEDIRLGVGTQPEGCFNYHLMKDLEYVDAMLMRNLYLSSAPSDRYPKFWPRAGEMLISTAISGSILSVFYWLTHDLWLVSLAAWPLFNSLLPRVQRAWHWWVQRTEVEKVVYAQFIAPSLYLIDGTSAVEDRKKQDQQINNCERTVFSRHVVRSVGGALGEYLKSLIAQAKRWFTAIMELVKTNVENRFWLQKQVDKRKLPQAVFDYKIEHYKTAEYHDQFARDALTNLRFSTLMLAVITTGINMFNLTGGILTLSIGSFAIVFNVVTALIQYYQVKTTISKYRYHQDGTIRRLEKEADNRNNLIHARLAPDVLRIIDSINKLVFQTTESTPQHIRENWPSYAMESNLNKNSALRNAADSLNGKTDNSGRVYSGVGVFFQRGLRRFMWLIKTTPKSAFVASVVLPLMTIIKLGAMAMAAGSMAVLASAATMIPFAGVIAFAALSWRCLYARPKEFVNEKGLGNAGNLEVGQAAKVYQARKPGQPGGAAEETLKEAS